MDTLREEIESIYREYGSSVVAADLDRWLGLWTDDGVQLPPGAPINVGVEEIRQWLTGMFGVMRMLEFDISLTDVEVFGDVAIGYGTFTNLAEPVAGGERVPWDGKYLTVFRKQSDGSWKIYRDISNSSILPT